MRDETSSAPVAGASISTVTLSVSISMIGSPLDTIAPSGLSHLRILPVSCAISSAGMITLVANGFPPSPFSVCSPAHRLDHLDDVVAHDRFVRARRREGTGRRVIVVTRDHQVIGRKARDDLVPVFRHDDFLFDTRRAPSVSGGPEGFESKHHPGLISTGCSSETAADHWLFQMASPTPCPYWSANAASSFGNPNSVALGHTAAMSPVVQPGRTNSIAASRYSRHRL